MLRNLRRQDMVIPGEFKEAHPSQSIIIESLLDWDPTNRPSAREMLESQLLPARVEKEVEKDVQRLLSNPSTVFYRESLKIIFESGRRMESLPKSDALPTGGFLSRAT